MTLDEAIERYTSNAEHERTDGSLQGCLEFKQLAEWLKELKQLREQTRWIPVSERLPERDVDVLTYHRNESYDYQYVSWIDDYSGEWVGFMGSLSDEVLAWMPLPEPYKGESEDAE